MYRWYQDAQVCYAYLSDVSGGRDKDPREDDSEFRRSRWFTRGWTLQELLAPEIVIFFDRDWDEIGTKSTLEGLVELITGIKHLSTITSESPSIAQRMSWAATRETTRVEDKAYCLMGLFGVNMPLLYGEGKNAFLRLQLEIIRISNDESIFAWSDDGSNKGLLANSPAAFEHSGDILALYKPRPPYSMTNNGLQIEVELVLRLGKRVAGEQREIGASYIVPLNCAREGDIQDKGTKRLAVLLKRFSFFKDTFFRASGHLDYHIQREELPEGSLTESCEKSSSSKEVAKPGKTSESSPSSDHHNTSDRSHKQTDSKTLIYVRQGGISYSPPRQAQFSIITGTLVKYGFSITPKPDCFHLGLSYLEQDSTESFAFSTPASFKCSNGAECFSLSVESFGGRVWLDIEPLGNWESGGGYYSFDRVRMFLPSGNVVTATLKRKAREGVPIYVVEILIENRRPLHSKL